MRSRKLADDAPTVRPPSGPRVREVRSRDTARAPGSTRAAREGHAPDDETEVPLMSELRTKRVGPEALDTEAAAEALRPARLPRDAGDLLRASSAPPAPRQEPAPTPPASPAGRAVLLVLGGVLAMWVVAMLVLAVVHYAP